MGSWLLSWLCGPRSGMKRAALDLDDASAALARKLAREEAAAASSSSPPPKLATGIFIDLCTPEAEERPAAAAATAAAAAAAAPPSRLTLLERGPQAVPALARVLATFEPCLAARAQALPVQYDSWTCGYANLGAMLRNIAQAGRHDLATDVARGNVCRPTDVAALQALVESAWREGFDPASAVQFDRSLVGKRGRAGWIGAPEMVAVLWHLRVDAMIVEVVFERGDADQRSGSAVCEAVATCLKQQRGGSPAVTQLPIVLQGSSHSRTVLGVTSGTGAARTLVLRDPNDRDLGVVRCLSPSSLDGKPYQLVIVRSTRRLSETEARKRMGEPEAAALWRHGRWKASASCPEALRKLS